MEAFQLDLFEERDPYREIREEVIQSKDALRRTQKRFFAEQNNLAKEIIKLNQDLDRVRMMMLQRVK